MVALSSPSSKSLPDNLSVIFEQPTTDFSSITFKSKALEIANSYADEEDREWYENQYEAIGSATELKEALLLCKDLYAIDPKWKSGTVERILGYISESAPDKPQIGHLSPMQVKVAVSCASLDSTFGAGIKNTMDYYSHRALVASKSTPKHCVAILTRYSNQYMEIFFRDGEYAPNDEDAAAQLVKAAFRGLLKSAYVLHHHKEKGKMIDDMTPIQVLLVGRLMKAFADKASSKEPSTSSEKWSEEFKRLGKILVVAVLAFCSAIAHIYMNLEDYYMYKVGKKDTKNVWKGRRAFRQKYRLYRIPKTGKRIVGYSS